MNLLALKAKLPQAKPKGVIKMNIQKASELKIDPKLKVLVFGTYGCGKTHFLSTAPKPLIADIDGGTSTLIKMQHINPDMGIVKISNTTDWLEFIRFVLQDKHSYETICVDSLTGLSRIIERDDFTNEKNPVPNRGDYKIMLHKMRKEMSALLCLPHHIILTSLENLHKDSNGVILKGVPDLIGRQAEEVPGMIDYIGYLASNTRTTGVERKLYFRPYSVYKSRDRVDILPKECKPNFGMLIAELTNNINKYNTKGGDKNENKSQP